MRTNPVLPGGPVFRNRATDIRPLPLALPQGEREGPADYLSRLSFRNGRDGLHRICRDFGIKMEDIFQGNPDAIRVAALLGSVKVSDLEAHAFKKLDDRRTVYREQVFHPKMKTYLRIRFCPACLREDLERGSGRVLSRPWRRAEWLMADLHTCPSHSLELVDLGPDLGKKVVDFSLMVAEHIPHLEKYELAAIKRTATSFELYLLDRVSGTASLNRETSWLDTIPLYAVVLASKMTGAVAIEGIRLSPGFVPAAASHRFSAAGFEVLAGGAAAFRVFLENLLSADRLPRSRFGPKAAFGRLYQWLAAAPHDPAYDPFRNGLRDAWLETVACGPDDPIRPFGWPLPERRLHSVYSASLEYGIDQGSMRKILFARGIARPEQKDLTNDQVTFDAAQNVQFLKDLRDCVPLKLAAHHLGITTMLMQDLMNEGLLLPMLGGNAEESAHHFFRRTDLDGFVAKLLKRADPALADDPRLLGIKAAAQRFFQARHVVLRLVLDGKLSRVGLRSGTYGMESILVDPVEIAGQLPIPSAPGLTANEAQDASGIYRTVLGALAREGLLRTHLGKQRQSGTRQTYFDPVDLECFQKDWVALSKIADGLDLSPRMAIARLRAAGLEPAPFSKKVGAVFYGTAEISAFDRRQLPSMPMESDDGMESTEQMAMRAGRTEDVLP